MIQQHKWTTVSSTKHEPPKMWIERLSEPPSPEGCSEGGGNSKVQELYVRKLLGQDDNVKVDYKHVNWTCLA
jgi:hypothetical protein